MGALFDAIREAVDEGRYLVTKHGAERLRQRGIPMWQVVDGLPGGVPLAERPDDLPFPSVEVREMLPDGTEIKAVWSFVPAAAVAQLVTVHHFDR
jgi:hypothetical protein